MKSDKNIERSIKKLAVESGDRIHARILEKLLRKLDESKRQAIAEQASVWRMIGNSTVSKIAAAFLIISTSVACFVLSGRVTDLKAELELARRDIALARQDVAITPTDNSATINLYLKEHQDVVARHASLDPTTPQSLQMRVSQDDILYYEIFDDEPEYVHPGYALDQVRRIDGREALQLLYTDGINSISLFEQSLDGRRGLEPKDFREYAVYRNTERAAGTILAWKDDVLSYVLIGNIEMSQLMNMAQSISAGK